VFRYKAIIGRSLRARTLSSQKTEARVACSVLNRMTRLGMPVSQRIAAYRLKGGDSCRPTSISRFVHQSPDDILASVARFCVRTSNSAH
jgi:hypothetical protein